MVELLMHLLEMRIGDVSVDLRGGDGLMAQKLLDRADICAVGKKRGRKRVTERVRRYIFYDA